MQDGLYRVEYKDICAGFTILNGKVQHIAPILKKRFDYWKTIAVKIK